MVIGTEQGKDMRRGRSSEIRGQDGLAHEDQLDSEGTQFLATIPAHVRPSELPVRFPRIINRCARFWVHPHKMKPYFEGLILSGRGRREGFPFKVMMEILALHDYYVNLISTSTNTPNSAPDEERAEQPRR